MRGARANGAAALACLVCACTAPERSAEPSASPPTSQQRAPNQPGSGSETGEQGTPSTNPATTPPPTEPLALAVSVHRPRLRLTVGQARGIVSGEVTSWSELGQPGGRLVLSRGRSARGSVMTSTNAVAVVPASRLTPLVQAATVGGTDPLRAPNRYPLTTASSTSSKPVVTTVTVVGDIMLGRSVGAATPGEPAAALAPLSQRLAAADVTIGNLESTLSQAGPAEQGGDSFAAEPAVIGPLAGPSGFDVLSLANNHAGDFGDLALRQTLRRLDASPIQRVGAGVDARDAWRPVIVERDGVQLGFVAFNAIGETPRATRSRAGAAEVRMQPRTGPLNADDLARATAIVRRLDREVDVALVLPHWGDQYTNQAVPDQQTVGTALLRAGADIVVGGHPHWVQGVDVHRGRLVVNSLGNFVFDMDFSTETQQGVLLELVCWDDEVMSARFTPYVIGRDFAPRLVQGPIADIILERMWQTSDPPFAS